MEDYALISVNTPLISNLNMLENIALIKEVQTLTPTRVAQEEADLCLRRVGLKGIGLKRLTELTSFEIFCVCFIRAMMTAKDTIVIITPFYLVKNLNSIDKIIECIKKLDTDKNIVILDTISNKIKYKGVACSIVK